MVIEDKQGNEGEWYCIGGRLAGKGDKMLARWIARFRWAVKEAEVLYLGLGALGRLYTNGANVLSPQDLLAQFYEYPAMNYLSGSSLEADMAIADFRSNGLPATSIFSDMYEQPLAFDPDYSIQDDSFLAPSCDW